jgi:hypothetical protein
MSIGKLRKRIDPGALAIALAKAKPHEHSSSTQPPGGIPRGKPLEPRPPKPVPEAYQRRLARITTGSPNAPKRSRQWLKKLARRITRQFR